MSGDDYIIIPAEDDSVRPITVGVETTGGVTLIGGEVGIGIEKVLKAAVTLDGKLDANMAVAAETDLSQQEFLSLTGQSTIGNGILDSFGFITTNWKETVKEALGNWTPFGRLTLSLLGKSDDPLGLMRKGYGDLHVVLERTLNAESALGVNIGVGLGLGVGLSAGVYGKVYANTDIVVSNDVDYTFTRSELSPSDDVGDTTATASALLPRQTSAYTLGADDWDVFAFLSPASGTHQFSISAGTAQNFLILIRDPKERKVLKRVVASSGTTSRSFCAQEQGQYNLEIVAVATTTPGTYGVNWTPGKPDGTFSSGTVLYDTTGGINIVDRGDKAYACRLEEHSPATLTQTITLLQAKPVLTFSYRMATYGDGDEIQVRANGTVVWSLPIDNDQSDFVFTPSIDLSAYAGQSVELQIALLSVGTANASFEVDDIMLCEALTVGPQIGVTDNCDDPSDMAVTVPETTMGVSSDMFVFSLVNSGDAVLRVSSFAKGGSNPEDFVITVKNGTGTSVDWATDGFDITPGNVYTVEVIFQPSSADGGSRRSGAIAFETNDPQNSSVTLSVTGTVNRPPDRPDLASPSNGATNVSLTPILEASLFSDPDGNAHEASQWQIAASSDFASPVWDSGETSTDKTSQAVPSGGLSYSATYHWRVRYQDSQGAWSEWSDSRSFTVDRYSPVYRFWKASDNTHFYTIKEGEKQKLIDNYAHVYTYEGAAYYAYVKDQPPTGTLPVYRFWKPSDNTHFYTIKESEKDKLIREYPHIYTYEGPAYYAYVAGQQPAGTLPVYRFWKWAGNTHFFTIKESEKDKLIRDFSDIFTFENIVWYTYAG